MTFLTFPYEPRTLSANESRLDKVRNAARLGLKGDTLALASGMLPTEFRQLSQFDPAVELAVIEGRAIGEMQVSTQLHASAEAGDSKAQLAILQHIYGWQAKQTLDVNITSINLADVLKEARERTQQTIDMDEEDEQISNIKQIERIPKAIEQPTEQPFQQRRRRHA